MMTHAPILQVVLPLMAAPICFISSRFLRFNWIFACAISWIGLFFSITLFQQAQEEAIIYELGGWAAPWGIVYVIDRLNAFVLVIISAIAAIVFPYSLCSIESEINPQQRGLYFTCMLLCLAGLLGIAITGDAFNLFVLLEVSSLSTYTLIAMGQDRRALASSFQYLMMGTIGATFILIGVGFLYSLTGTLNMADLADRIPALHDTRTLKVAYSFLIVGIGLKLAMFPLHLWLPNAYAYAPSAVTVFLASTATKVAIYMLLRFLFFIFGAKFSFELLNTQWFLVGLGLIAMLVASIVAVFQRNIKRMLAYSSVAQVGYILLGIGLLNVNGLTAALLHIFNHALIKGALFMALGAICFRVGHAELKNIAGIGKMMPWTMAAFVAGGISLIGIPFSVGFISKWYLILAAIERGWWPIVIIISICSIIAVMYIWRVIEAAYFRPPASPGIKYREAPLQLLIPTWILVILNFFFGTSATLTSEYAINIAEFLLGSGL